MSSRRPPLRDIPSGSACLSPKRPIQDGDRPSQWAGLVRPQPLRLRRRQAARAPACGPSSSLRPTASPRLRGQRPRRDAGPGQRLYHEESNQEDFLVLHGECIAVIEEQERPLRQWDFVHCPPGTRHVFVGAGDGPCAILMIGARDPTIAASTRSARSAARHGADAPTASRRTPSREAYRDFPPEAATGVRFSPLVTRRKTDAELARLSSHSVRHSAGSIGTPDALALRPRAVLRIARHEHLVEAGRRRDRAQLVEQPAEHRRERVATDRALRVEREVEVAGVLALAAARRRAARPRAATPAPASTPHRTSTITASP